MHSKEKFFLCLDSASYAPSISLFSPSSGQEVESWIERGLTSESLLNGINHLLRKRKISLQEIESIVVSLGPGSFTGIRAGISVAKGLRFGCRGLKLLGASNLRALAMMASETVAGRVLCVMNAGRDRFFTQEFFLDGKYRVRALCETKIEASGVVSQYEGNLGLVFGTKEKNEGTSLHLAKYLGLVALVGDASEIIEPLYVSDVTYRK